MASHRHAALWIDHQQAKIFHVDLEGFDERSVQSPHHHVHRHPKSGDTHQHPDDAVHFFGDVAKALADVEQVLVLGPSTAKLQFIRYLHAHDRALEAKVVGVESSDHPTDGQLLAHVKQYFHVKDLRAGG
jgi:stalled ribosome rescue protein Dom34